MATLAELIDNLVADQWRVDNPFSPEVASCHEDLLNAVDDAARGKRLAEWIAQHQPCFFGQIAAAKGWIDFCFLTEEDLRQSDGDVSGKIHQARKTWRRRARHGESHGFVILAMSNDLAIAEPSKALMEVARRIAELYLCRDVLSDRIVHDELFLEARERRSWSVGVNFFSSQADRRWWKDHRIPGGIAFSMNSVGHMACVRRLGKDMGEEDQSQGLRWALRTAMQLLDKTMPGVSGRNTWLHDIAERPEPSHITCPEMPKALSGRNRCEYAGLYHTDQSIPSAYFKQDHVRPDGPFVDDLDLTYLHHDSPDNPDYRSMGAGVPHA